MDKKAAKEQVEMKIHEINEVKEEAMFQSPELIDLGNARDLTRGMPSARWQDGAFNPTRYRQ